jgi:hypothetical protein
VLTTSGGLVGLLGLYNALPGQVVPLILRMGDSITKQTERSRKWNGILFRDYVIHPIMLNWGVSGEKIVNIKNRLNGTTKAYIADNPEISFVIPIIGTNDVNTGKPWSTDPNKATMAADLSSAYTLAKANGAILLPGSMSDADFNLDAALDGIAGPVPYNDNLIIPAMATQAHPRALNAGVPVINLQARSQSGFPGEFDVDGYHPNNTGDITWGEYNCRQWGFAAMGQPPSTAYTPTKLVRLDGVDDWIEIPLEDSIDMNLLPTTAWSVDILVKIANGTNTLKTIIARGGSNATVRQLHAFVSSGGKLQVYVGGSATSQIGTTTINDGQWHHIMIVCTGSTHRAWVDGVAQYAATATAAQSSSYSVTIGARHGTLNDDYADWLAADLQQFNFWNTALSDANAAAISTPTSPVPFSSYAVLPATHLSLGEGPYPFCRDHIGTNHAIIYNATSAAFV